MNLLNKKIYFRIIIILTLILFLTTTLIFNYNYQKLLDDHNKLTANYSDLFIRYNNLLLLNENTTQELLDLDLEYKDLNEKYNLEIQEKETILKELNTLDQEYTGVLKDYNQLLMEIGIFKENIEESMNWFRNNSNIDSLKESRKIKNLLRTCIDCQEDNCYIKTACIDLINKKELYLEYELDSVLLENTDKLQTIESFLINRKGDCEDFSLFYVAQLRYLIDHIESINKTPIIEAIIESNTNKPYYITNKWYYPNGVEKEILSQNYIYPYIACGNLYDPNTNDFGGHCVVLLSDKKINNYQDLLSLNNAKLIEPQNGMYLGNLENKDGLLFLDSGNIFSIITDNDYYLHENRLFREKTNRDWYSYGYYLQKINELE